MPQPGSGNKKAGDTIGRGGGGCVVSSSVARREEGDGGVISFCWNWTFDAWVGPKKRERHCWALKMGRPNS